MQNITYNILTDDIELILDESLNKIQITITSNIATNKKDGYMSSDNFNKLSTIEENATSDSPISIEEIDSLFNENNTEESTE